MTVELKGEEVNDLEKNGSCKGKTAQAPEQCQFLYLENSCMNFPDVSFLVLEHFTKMDLPNALSIHQTGDQKITVQNLVTLQLCSPACVVYSAVGTAQELQEKN